ncbi:MAG: MucBP domain-containing protein [Clostridiales bacterium]|nr:MucBP domain-containing protein [Clostridiales bacterium]
MTGNAYKEWYDDVSLTNGGYPLFAEKSPVYELTVNYVYDDGSEAMPSVVLYLEEGQAYDVDSYIINGYSTDDIEYTGVMPANDLELRVIYSKNETFDGSVSELSSSSSEAESGQIYSVSSTADLTALAEYVNAGKNTSGVTFKQTASLDMTDVSFTPIGTESAHFEGTYDGNYKEISGMTYTGGADYSGLFGYADNACFENMYLSGTYSGGNYTGGIVGYAENSSIDNVVLSELTVAGGNYTGGIIGYAVSSSVNASSVDGSVSGSSYVGGIAGAISNTDVKNVSNNSIVTGGSYVGGTCGNALSGEIINCYNLGTVSSTASNAGGIAGAVDSVEIENCYNAGSISGSSNVGSLAGTGTESVTSNYYLEGTASASVGSGSEGTNIVFTSETIDDITEGLNSWIESANTSGLYKWYVGDESIYPVFGALDNDWLTDYSVSRVH